jgi:3-deoxy-7-phosphoheptulonate synthase
MLVIMRKDANLEQINRVINGVEARGYRAHLLRGADQTIVCVVGEGSPGAGTPKLEEWFGGEAGEMPPGAQEIVPISKAYKLTSREFIPRDTVFTLAGAAGRGATFGGPGIAIMAGPCSVESRTQLLETAQAVKEAGGHMLRGGAFKPRTSPYSFQGMGEAGLELLAEAREASGLPVVTEVMTPEQAPLVCRYADMLQIGARNMQNYALLHAVGESQHPVLLKRGLSATIDELLMAAEYILSHGNRRVALCERGIRTFETATRNTTDINAVPVLKARSHLPVILDPSHSTGEAEYVTAIARAAIAAGADGLIIEVHTNPKQAMSDGQQSLTPEQFGALVKQVAAIAGAVGRG